MTTIRAVVFDLGGVLVDIDFGRALAAWQPASRLAPDALRAAFGFDEAYLQHEVGALAATDYFAHLRRQLALEADDAFLRAGWNALLIREIPQTLALVDRLAPELGCHVLSNTNAVHLERIEEAFPHLLPRFGQVFASHQMGLRKPDARAFRHVTDALGVAPGEVLFFDDLPANVEAARACGLQAALVTEPADVERELLRLGLLRAG